MNTVITANDRRTAMQSKRSRNHLLFWTGRVLRWLLLTLLALVGIGASYQVLATARDARAFPPPGQLVDVGGYKLHLHCLGTGATTVITENGLGGSSPDWSLVQPAVSQQTRICKSRITASSSWRSRAVTPFRLSDRMW